VVLGKLLDSLVIGKDVTVDAAEKRDGNFQNGNEKVVGRLADWPVVHERKQW
jgi:hypothetical protein